MERDDLWSRVIVAAGAIGGTVALVYVIGGAALSLRYDGFGLPGQQAAAYTPRETLLAAGLRTLVVWAALGIALILALRALPDASVRAVAAWLRTPVGVITVAVIVVALVLLLNVWWPLVALGAVIAIVLASVYWESRPARRLLVSALSVSLVAVAYEADRISYLVEWTCVDLAPKRHLCGSLIGQQDRGFYLGVPTEAAGPYRLTFIPATRVDAANSHKELARVIPSRAEARRETLISRITDVHVR